MNKTNRRLKKHPYKRDENVPKKGEGLGRTFLKRLPFSSWAVKDVLNKVVDDLPIEMNLPGYQYCGPGTHPQERLKRGDPGVNKLDQACMRHDIAYENSMYETTKEWSRKVADSRLMLEAIECFKSKDSSIGEKLAALTVLSAMGVKF